LKNGVPRTCEGTHFRKITDLGKTEARKATPVIICYEYFVGRILLFYKVYVKDGDLVAAIG
jgi:hypothetical protein